MERRLSALLSAICFFFVSLSSALAESSWRYGDSIPVTCLNRTVETGEHISDSHGRLQYIPFYTCSETSAPLSLKYGQSATTNCTIALTDPLYHLLEFYIHNDAPLTCRIPSSPSTLAATTRISGKTSDEAEQQGWTPLVMALSGTLQFSHIHVANELNLVIHTEDTGAQAKKTKKTQPKIESASAYSISPSSKQTKLIIGDSLTLTFHTRFYSGSYLPLTNAATLHGFWSTLSYCIFAAGASAAICIVYFRGVELPRRLRFHGRDRLGGGGVVGMNGGGGLPKYNGYGMPVQNTAIHMGNGGVNGNGNGYSGYGGYGLTTGKRD